MKFEGTDLTTPKPSLATSWDIKDAGTNWDITFKLKSGVKFASGNPLTADDVVYSFQRAIKLNKSPAFLYTDIAGLKPENIKATDLSTVVVTMPKTSSTQTFLVILAFTIGGIIVRDREAPVCRGRSESFVVRLRQDHWRAIAEFVDLLQLFL